MKVLVTGATGFLGSHTVAALQARGDEVLAIGRDPVKLGRLTAPTVRADLTDLPALTRACRGVDAVVHTAALSAPWGRLEDFQRSNVLGTQNVLNACLQTGVRRLIHISSPAVIFDDQDQFAVPDDAPYPLRFSSHYALTKKLAEELVRAAPLERVVLRPKALYGPGDRSLLPRLVRAARLGRLPQIGDGQNRLELTYISDAVTAILFALETPLTREAPYTITGGQPVLLWGAVRRLLLGLGLSDRLPVISLPVALVVARSLESIAALTGREPRLTRYTAQILARTQTYDTSRARTDLGFVPRVGLEEGLERTLVALRTEP